MLRRAIPAAIFFLMPLIAATESGLIQVTGVRSWSRPGSTRIIVEASGAFDYRSDHATNPERFFIDVFKARPWIEQRRILTHQVNDALVRRVRIAETQPGTTRIVFDLVGTADFKISTLATPDRLVIEFHPAAAGARGVTSTKISRRGRQFRPFIPPPAGVPSPPPVIALTTPPDVDPLPLATSRPLMAFTVKLPLRRTPTPTLTSVRQIQESTLASMKVLPAGRPPSSGTTPGSARASEDASHSLTRALGLKINRIIIDAGHGGHDDGTIGANGVLEKDVVLDVALRVAKLVQAGLGAEVVLTRSDDTFIPLQERTSLANQHHGDLFLSIHANSSPSPSVAGTETFYLNFTSSPGAIDVAARENSTSDKTVGELKDLIQQISLNDKIAESQTFAQTIEKTLALQAARSNPLAKDRGVKRAPFVVLIGASMPSILAEIGFLSNARDESNLNKPEYRQKIAEALYKGVAEYSQSLSHFEAAAPSGALARAVK